MRKNVGEYTHTFEHFIHINSYTVVYGHYILEHMCKWLIYTRRHVYRTVIYSFTCDMTVINSCTCLYLRPLYTRTYVYNSCILVYICIWLSYTLIHEYMTVMSSYTCVYERYVLIYKCIWPFYNCIHVHMAIIYSYTSVHDRYTLVYMCVWPLCTRIHVYGRYTRIHVYMAVIWADINSSIRADVSLVCCSSSVNYS